MIINQPVCDLLVKFSVSTDEAELFNELVRREF